MEIMNLVIFPVIFVIAIMLSFRKETIEHVPMNILDIFYDENNRPVIEVETSCNRDLDRITNLWTYPGDVFFVYEHDAPNHWFIRLEDFNTYFLESQDVA